MKNRKNRKITLLLADDDPDDRFLARDALNSLDAIREVRVVEDGAELLAYLRREGKYADPAASPRPDMILVDLNMPRMDGRQAIRQIKQDVVLKPIPLIVLTTSNAEEDVLNAYRLGANSFMTKPLTYTGFLNMMDTLIKYWFETVELPKVNYD